MKISYDQNNKELVLKSEGTEDVFKIGVLSAKLNGHVQDCYDTPPGKELRVSAVDVVAALLKK